jgi:neutral ceramidase
MLPKILKKVGLFFAYFLGALLLFLVFSVSPIDRYNYQDQDYYRSMMKELDTVSPLPLPVTSDGYSVGYSKVSITPDHHTALAGYGTRRGKVFSQIHDSIFVRTLIVSNGTQNVAIVSADLLIIPPAVTELLERDLPSIGFSINTTYLGATHTHNSIGNWQKGAAAFLYGTYSDSIVHFIADRIRQSIAEASKNALPSTIRYGKFPVNSVSNRIDDNGGLDSLVHVIDISRNDNTKLALVSFTAHATCISMDDMALSRDYPGVLVDKIEHGGYDFAMFMAGAVGSHAGRAPEHGWSCTEWIPERIYERFEKHKDLLTITDSTLGMIRVPLMLGDPQVKISMDWKVRPWLFRSAVGEYPVYLTALRIGNVILLGAPCDYSGELTPSLYKRASEMDMHVMVTSFNGGYIGYITPDRYYDVDHHETRFMNWYGPGSGSYLDESMIKLLDDVSQD